MSESASDSEGKRELSNFSAVRSLDHTLEGLQHQALWFSTKHAFLWRRLALHHRQVYLHKPRLNVCQCDKQLYRGFLTSMALILANKPPPEMSEIRTLLLLWGSCTGIIKVFDHLVCVQTVLYFFHHFTAYDRRQTLERNFQLLSPNALDHKQGGPEFP